MKLEKLRKFISRNKFWCISTGITMALGGLPLFNTPNSIILGRILIFSGIGVILLTIINELKKEKKAEGKLKEFLVHLIDKYMDEKLGRTVKEKLNRKLAEPNVFTVSWLWKLSEVNMLQLAYWCILRILGRQGAQLNIYILLSYDEREKEKRAVKQLKKIIKKACPLASCSFIPPNKKLRKRLQLVDKFLIDCAQNFLNEYLKKCDKNIADELDKFIYEVYTMLAMWMEVRNITKDRILILIDRARYQGFYKQFLNTFDTFIPILVWFDVPQNREKWLFIGETKQAIRDKLQEYPFKTFEFLYKIIILNFAFTDNNFQEKIKEILRFDKNNNINLRIEDDWIKIGECQNGFIKIDNKRLRQIYESDKKNELIRITCNLWYKLSSYLQ